MEEPAVPISSSCSKVPEAVQTDAYPMRNSNAVAGVADYRILDAERVS